MTGGRERAVQLKSSFNLCHTVESKPSICKDRSKTSLHAKCIDDDLVKDRDRRACTDDDTKSPAHARDHLANDS